MIDVDVRRTKRWRGVVAVPLAALAVGLVANRPDLLLLAVVGVAFAAYPRATTEPDLELGIERELDDERPSRGDDVEVTVTVRNEGSKTLFDLRVVDGVPPALTVASGSPRHGGVLRPGGSFTYSYTLTAERGEHRFEPATAVARDLSGEREVEATVATETEIDCTAATASAPLRRQTLAAVGQVTSNRGGSGVEFHRTREYQPGDAVNRIDWNRYALTGEPTTVEFRREQAARVVVAVDAREAAYRGRADEPHAVAHGVSAARQVVASLAGSRNQVGVAGFGRSLAWVAPGAGREHADDLRRVLATHETFAATPPNGESAHEEQADRLRERLPPSTQVVLLSPLCDDAIVATARSLDAHGYTVSVVSPTVTRDDAVGRRLAAVERRNRATALRNAGVPVVEWDPDRPLAAAVTEAESGWSR